MAIWQNLGVGENLALVLGGGGLALLIAVLVGGTVLMRRRVSEAEQRQRAVEARARTILNTTADGILALDSSGRILSCNPAAEGLFEASFRALVNQPIHRFVTDLDLRDCPSLGKQGEGRELRVLREVRGRRADGSLFPLEVSMNALKEGEAEIIVVSLRDMTERQAAREAIEYLAFHDALTGLPNRSLLKERLQFALVEGRRRQDYGGLLFIDLDGFKALNDSYGHACGDRLLQQVARRLSDCARAGDTVARLGGDEFVVVLEALGDDREEAAEHAGRVAERVLEAFRAPFLLHGHEHFNSPSIGVSLFGAGQSCPEELLKQADIAMYQAKSEGGAGLRFYKPEMQTSLRTRSDLEAQLRKALQHDEFVLHYQPQLDSKGRIVGAEALLRWRQPDGSLMQPLDFIPLCEEIGLIHPLGHWVLETVCQQLATWQSRPELREVCVSVNVSAHQFRHPDFVDQVISLLRDNGIRPGLLTLELTESVLLTQTEDVITRMNQLKALGLRFSLDDFGTGYSSLSYLKRLPLDQLKIDKSFVKDILSDGSDAALARMIISLARLFDLAEVAEGVETREQRNFLAGHGCRIFQGYLFARPMELREFEDYVVRAAAQEKPRLTLVEK